MISQLIEKPRYEGRFVGYVSTKQGLEYALDRPIEWRYLYAKHFEQKCMKKEDGQVVELHGYKHFASDACPVGCRIRLGAKDNGS